MTHALDRRSFLRAAASGAGSLAVLDPAAAWAARAHLRPQLARGAGFGQGVASGEPGARAITLWTHLDGIDREVAVRVEIARDAGFRQVVHRADAVAAPATGGNARLRVAGSALAPGEEYHYRFETADASSPIGRFRTARPAGSLEPVRIAFFSCQELIAGYYHAHRDLAGQDVDLVVCLGDYIYEQAFADTLSPNPPVREDMTAPDGETQTLAEYRAKYALYHTDANLLEVRRRFPLVVIWDDHEVEDNYAADKPGGAATSRRVPFAERRANGYRAFFEHHPRMPSDGRIHGMLQLGAADLFLLDTRQFRDDQPCNPSDQFVSQPCPASTTDDPARTLLGAAQKQWLKDGLAASRAPWRVIANQVMITSLDAPPRNPLNTDSWDGYGAERAELIDHLGRAGIEDVAFVTGDIHTFFAGDVTRTGRRTLRGVEAPDPLNGPPRATEFVGGSVTSPGVIDRLASGEAERNAAATAIDAGVLGNNPQIAYSNQAYKGYAIAEASGDDLKITYRAVHDTRKPDSSAFALRRFHVERGRPLVIDDGGPLPLPAPAAPGPIAPGLVPGDRAPRRS